MIDHLKLEDAALDGYRIRGDFKKTDLIQVMRPLLEKMEQGEEVRLFLDLEPGHNADAGLLFQTFKWWLSEEKEQLEKLRKVAVLSDHQGVKWLGTAEAALLPGLQLKVFEPSKRKDALSWLRQ